MTPSFRILFFVLIVWNQAASAQNMWPGDANNNGIVNGADFIYYGLAHGSTGPERPGATSDWVPQAIDPWAGVFPNSVNYAFADFDGDGEVDNSDQSKFEGNWDKVHGTLLPDGYGGSTAGAPLKIRLIPSQVQVLPGTAISIEVQLGSVEQPVDDLYGFAFKMHYDRNLVNNAGSDIDFEEPVGGSWIGLDGSSRKFFQKIETTGRAEAGITKTNLMTASGSGTVGAFGVIIEDIIVGLTRDTFRITIDSIVLYNGGLQAFAVEGDTVEVEVIAPELIATQDAPFATSIHITPNPTSGQCLIEISSAIVSWQLLDAQGRVAEAKLHHVSEGRYLLNTSMLPSGLYIFRGQTKNGTFERRICMLK